MLSGHLRYILITSKPFIESVIVLNDILISVVMLNVVTPCTVYLCMCMHLFIYLPESVLIVRMRLCHPPDGSTSPKYKFLCFITTKFFLQREECTSL
jgi:hypothetical protein